MMSDEHLTDHEWRLKMAAEGKAIYVPGKTVEQVKAELENEGGRKARHSSGAAANFPETKASSESGKITIALTREEADCFRRAADEAIYHYSNVRAIFEMLWSGFAGGNLGSDDPGVSAILDVSGRTFERVANEDGEHLARLASILRGAIQEGGAA